MSNVPMTKPAEDSAPVTDDLVVLSDDYFDPQRVPDDKIKLVKSALTVVDGRIVYNDMR